MSPDTLRIVGEALYGPRWQSEMARDLDVADRTVRRWLSGDAIPPGVGLDLLRVCGARSDAVEFARTQLHASIASQGAS